MKFLEGLKCELEDKITINLFVILTLAGILFYGQGIEGSLTFALMLPAWFVIYLVVSELYWWVLRR